MGGKFILVRESPFKMKIRTFVLFVYFISLVTCVFAAEPELKIHFIDVGEGDSILIESADGKAALVDTGNLISGFRVAEYLKKNNIEKLDYLILTHPDLDHIGGAFLISQALKVENVCDNGQNFGETEKSSDIYRWYAELIRKNKSYRVLKFGDKFSIGQVNFKILWPAQPLPFTEFNPNSLVIMLEYGEFHCLLTGDLTRQGERKILEGKIDLKADVLKIGHHGAGDASSDEFLTAVSPKIAVISVDKANIRGYPAKEVIGRIEKAGVKLYRTDKDGDIVLSVDKDSNLIYIKNSI